MRTVLIRVAAALVLTAAAAPEAAAQQSLTINIGYFALRGDEDRSSSDVLIANRFDNALPLFFETKDFNGASISGEYFAPVGRFVEVGGGIGFYRRTVPSVYDTVTKPGGAEIRQDLKLRIVPITVAAKIIPFGRDMAVQPYVGAGVGVFNWRYSEIGEFVDASDRTIFADRFTGSGTELGPVVMFGVRFPVGDAFTTGGEIRYQAAKGTLSLDDFLGDEIDLGGFHYSWVLQFNFGR